MYYAQRQLAALTELTKTASRPHAILTARPRLLTVSCGILAVVKMLTSVR